MRPYRHVALLTLFLCTSHSVYAAEASFQNGARSTISRAMDLVSLPVSSVLVRTPLTFRPRETRAAREMAAKGFQIRVFRLMDDRALPSSDRDISGCVIYITSVIPVRARLDGTISIGELDESWLEMSYSRETARPGRFLLVFEESGPSEPIFRLRQKDADAYFKQGFVLTVDVNDKIPLEKIRDKYAAGELERVKLHPGIYEAPNKVPCYEYKPRLIASIAEDDGDLAAGELLACAASAPPASGIGS